MNDAVPKLDFSWKHFLVQSEVVGILVSAQYFLRSWIDLKPRPLTLDQGILLFLLFAAVNLAIVLAGDRLLRRRGRDKRWQYMAVGALAASASHAVALAPAAYVIAARGGMLAALLAVPLVIGAVTAFLLHKSLGYSVAGDDLHLHTSHHDGDEAAGDAVTDIGSARYYDGPLQVCTSAPAGVVAALVGGLFYVMISLFGLTADPLPAGATHPLMKSNPVLFALYGMCGLAVPFYIFVRRSHAFLQRHGKAAFKSYALAGVFVPLGFAAALTVVMGPFGIIFALPWVIPSTAAMATYHRLAGMEPLALPEDIEVRDPRALVSADHMRRRVRRIVPAR